MTVLDFLRITMYATFIVFGFQAAMTAKKWYDSAKKLDALIEDERRESTETEEFTDTNDWED